MSQVLIQIKHAITSLTLHCLLNQHEKIITRLIERADIVRLELVSGKPNQSNYANKLQPFIRSGCDSCGQFLNNQNQKPLQRKEGQLYASHFGSQNLLGRPFGTVMTFSDYDYAYKRSIMITRRLTSLQVNKKKSYFVCFQFRTAS